LRNKDKPKAQRILNLIRALRELNSILPGDKVKLPGEKPATYLGALEAGDIQVDYHQIHIFEFFDGTQVALELPYLNRTLGRLLY
jgi:hypothetical protein